MIETHIGIEGMMCPMCESHICEILRKAFPGCSVKASRRKKEAVLISDAPLDETLLTKTIEQTGYVPKEIAASTIRKRGLFSRR